MPRGTTDASAEPLEQPDPGQELTWRQREILEVVADYGRRHGYAPTMREIGNAVGLASPSSVSYQLSVLQDKGFLRRSAGRPRTIEALLPGQPVISLEADSLTKALDISPDEGDYVSVPLIGRISAGVFNLADQVIEGIFKLPKQLVGDGQLFMLAVAGDSMIGAAIAHGDWVVVRQQPEAQNGEIVAAMIDGEATVKTFKRTDDHVWLIPQNLAYTPILGDDATIMGKVVSVLRRV